jgi:hypothetical protein
MPLAVRKVRRCLTVSGTYLEQSVGGYDNAQGGTFGEFEVWIHFFNSIRLRVAYKVVDIR